MKNKTKQPLIITPPARRSSSNRHDTQLQNLIKQLLKHNTKNLKEVMRASNKAASATGSPASKLSSIRMEWLEACAEHIDDGQETFTPPAIYAELEKTGWTRETVLSSLCQACVEAEDSRHQCNVTVTSRMAATFKSGEFSNNNNFTYNACGLEYHRLWYRHYPRHTQDVGGCTNFQVLGKCNPMCTYHHRVTSIPDG